jgi:hypothetical protein
VFPDWPPLLTVFWTATLSALAAYVLLFIARREVALRMRRLGWSAAVVLVIRLGISVPGYANDAGDVPLTPVAAASLAPDFALTVVAAVSAAALLPCGRIWLCRAEARTLQQQLHTACAGLFLGYDEPAPGRFQFTAKAGTWRLRMVSITKGVQLLVLPRVAGPGKVMLLVQWLAKQYPGPVPRIHIVLKKE